MTPAEFIAKWSRAERTERSAAQQHFLDLCDLLDHPKPASEDPIGESFTFEKGAEKHGGGEDLTDEQILERLLALNLERAAR